MVTKLMIINNENYMTGGGFNRVLQTMTVFEGFNVEICTLFNEPTVLRIVRQTSSSRTNTYF